jgi:hypothetical protein
MTAAHHEAPGRKQNYKCIYVVGHCTAKRRGRLQYFVVVDSNTLWWFEIHALVVVKMCSPTRSFVDAKKRGKYQWKRFFDDFLLGRPCPPCWAHVELNLGRNCSQTGPTNWALVGQNCPQTESKLRTCGNSGEVVPICKAGRLLQSRAFFGGQFGSKMFPPS